MDELELCDLLDSENCKNTFPSTDTVRKVINSNEVLGLELAYVRVKKYETKIGILYESKTSDKFLNIWKAKKDKLKEAGFRVFNKDGVWTVSFMSFEDRE